MIREKLLIKVEDFEGADLVSSLVQDSIFHISLHSFEKKEKTLSLMLNRFCWESVPLFEEEKCYYRVHSGLYIHHVESINIKSNIKDDQYLNLLAFHLSEKEINLIFSDDKHICINVSGILIYLKDLHDKYPTLSLPGHDKLTA
ncbi:MAG: DUF2948 family protein [Holosporaceae bacterium]|jgi:hypothetical protein|nr:DUF2948 family protein [Holosporaceae bacterium]